MPDCSHLSCTVMDVPNTQEKAKCYENHSLPAYYLLTLCLINGVPGVGEVRHAFFWEEVGEEDWRSGF